MRVMLILFILLVPIVRADYLYSNTEGAYPLHILDSTDESSFLVGASLNTSLLTDSFLGCLLGGSYSYIILSNHIVNADLNETVYSTEEKQIVDAYLDGSLVVLTSDGDLISINDRGIDWVGHYSLPPTLGEIFILNGKIFVWGRGINQIFVFSMLGYPLGEISIKSAQAVFWVGSLGEELLGILYYSATGEYRLSILNLTTNTIITDFSVLDYYSSATDTLTYVMYSHTGSNTAIYIAAVSRSAPSVVIVEAYNLSGYPLPNWDNITLGPAYGFLYMGLSSTSLLVASGSALWLVDNGSVIDSVSVPGRIIEANTDGNTAYIFYVENTSGDGFLASYDLVGGNISFVDSSFLGFGLTGAVWNDGDYILVFFGGSRIVLVRDGIIKRVYNFLYPWHVFYMGNSTYVYSSTLIYSVLDRKIIYEANYPFSIVDVSGYQGNITVLESAGIGAYRVVVISSPANVFYSDWLSYSANAVSVGSVCGGLVPIGYESSGRFGVLLLDIASGQFVTFDLDIRPDDIVLFNGRYIIYQHLSNKFYFFDPDHGLVGMKYFEDNIVSIDTDPHLSLIAVETVDPLSTKYSYSILDSHLGTLFTIPDTQTRLIIQNRSVVVAVYDSGYRLKIFDVDGKVIGDVYLGRSTPTIVSPLGDNADGYIVGTSDGGLLLVDFIHGASRALVLSEEYEFLGGAPTKYGSVFVVERDYALYLLDVSVWWDYEFPYLSVAVQDIITFGGLRILNGTQLKINVYSSDDILIDYFNMSIDFLRDNYSLFSFEHAFSNKSSINLSIEYEVPPTADLLVITATTKDLAGRKQFFSTHILIDREAPRIKILAPNDTLVGSVDLLVSDDVGIAYVYAIEGKSVVPLRLVSSSDGAYVYRLSNVTGSLSVVAVDYTGKKVSIQLKFSGPSSNVSSYPFLFVIILLLIALFGVIAYYNRERIRTYLQKLREAENLE